MSMYIQAFRLSDGKNVPGAAIYSVDSFTEEFLQRYKANMEKQAGEPVTLFYCPFSEAPITDIMDSLKLISTIVDGQATNIRVDPDWQPPVPTPPIQDILAIIEDKLNRVPFTVHSQRFQEQKEYAKQYGIPWIKANPTCTIQEAGDAIQLALQAEFPNVPICVLMYSVVNLKEDGLIISYMNATHEAGLLAHATWLDFRTFVVSTPEATLRDYLRRF